MIDKLKDTSLHTARSIARQIVEKYPAAFEIRTKKQGPALSNGIEEFARKIYNAIDYRVNKKKQPENP